MILVKTKTTRIIIQTQFGSLISDKQKCHRRWGQHQNNIINSFVKNLFRIKWQIIDLLPDIFICINLSIGAYPEK